jgi:hypothetical protein
MPSKTAKQHRFMAANCKGNGKGKIAKSVACEFMHADKGKKFKKETGDRMTMKTAKGLK